MFPLPHPEWWTDFSAISSQKYHFEGGSVLFISICPKEHGWFHPNLEESIYCHPLRPPPKMGKERAPPLPAPSPPPPESASTQATFSLPLPPPLPPRSLSPPQKSKPPNPKIPLRGLKSLLRGDGFIVFFLFIF